MQPVHASIIKELENSFAKLIILKPPDRFLYSFFVNNSSQRFALTVYTWLSKPVLNLETLADIADQNKEDLTSQVAEFTVGPGKIQMGKTPQLMGVINLSTDSWYRESVCADSENANILPN